MKTYMTWHATCPKCKTKITQDETSCMNCGKDHYHMKHITTFGENTYTFECPSCQDNSHRAECPECNTNYMVSMKIKDTKRTVSLILIGTMITMIIALMIWMFG